MDRVCEFVMGEGNINGRGGYMSVILEGEKYYGGFEEMVSEIEKNEMGELREVVVKGEKEGEIGRCWNRDLVVEEMRLILLGK